MDVLWLVCGMFYGLIRDWFVPCFMAGLWTVLWLELGLFLWPVCGLPCGFLGLFCEHFTCHIWP